MRAPLDEGSVSKTSAHRTPRQLFDSDHQPSISSMPKYLYLNDPGSRSELADDVDIVVLRQRLADALFPARCKLEVLVDGLRGLVDHSPTISCSRTRSSRLRKRGPARRR